MNRKPRDQILPSQSIERIQDIDSLRGIALFGVILVNVFYFNVPAVYFDQYYGQYDDSINKIILYGVNWLFNGKFYPIFSFLFGLGFSIQFLKSLQKDGNPYIFLARRLLILLFFGLLHIVFVWEEDILLIYAVFGFILLLLIERSPKFIFRIAFFLYFIPIAFNVVDHLVRFTPQVTEISKPFNDFVLFYTTASYEQILQQRISIYLEKFSRLGVLISQLDRLAFFLFGLYAGKRNLVANFAKESRFWFKTFLIATCIFGVGFLVDKIWLNDLDELRNPTLPLAVEDIIIGITNLFQVFAYIIGFLLLLTFPQPRRFFAPLANIGRMAMTVYLAHTTFFSFLFYSFGIGLYGTLAPIQLFMISIIFFFVFVLLSLFWLSYFRYGPLEWLWRSLTYRKFLPFRRLEDKK